MVERGEQRRGREALRDEVGVGAVDHDRRAIGPSGELVEPGQAGHQVAEASIQPPRTGLALHAGRQHHHRRVAGPDVRVVHVPAGEGLGGEGLEDHVGPLDGPPRDLAAPRVGEVQADAQLAGVEVAVEVAVVDPRHAVAERRVEAQDVGSLRRLDLDDRRPVRRQVAGGHRTDAHPRQVEDVEAGERRARPPSSRSPGAAARRRGRARRRRASCSPTWGARRVVASGVADRRAHGPAHATGPRSPWSASTKYSREASCSSARMSATV